MSANPFPGGPTRVTLVLGGARSGKSGRAEALLGEFPSPWFYLATAQAFDDEMRARVAVHQSRRDARWRTLEAPHDLPAALRAPPAGAPLLVDCLTLWLSNLMLADENPEPAIGLVEDALCQRSGPTVLVSNEVGWGIVPENALARRFRDEQGRLNQRIAGLADRVELVVAGLPVRLK